MTSDGYFEPVPACQRAVHEAVEVLKSQGHEVVPLEIPYSSAKMVETYISLMGADGNWYSHHFSSPLIFSPSLLSSRYYYLKCVLAS
jgi:Asp-tRNA(Asn)/Glu-tRNA(Gln) amidotransferase A subunit family amidase